MFLFQLNEAVAPVDARVTIYPISILSSRVSMLSS
jgi:hypothetical protein